MKPFKALSFVAILFTSMMLFSCQERCVSCYEVTYESFETYTVNTMSYDDVNHSDTLDVWVQTDMIETDREWCIGGDKRKSYNRYNTQHETTPPTTTITYRKEIWYECRQYD